MNISPKVVASTLAAAIVTILVWALNQFAHIAIPDYVQGALTTILVSLGGYFTPHPALSVTAETRQEARGA